MDRSAGSSNKTYDYTKRVLGEFYGVNQSPTVVVFAGIHGNEKAGVKAIKSVLEKITESHMRFDGNLYFVLGNINALNKHVRFEKVDLNRIWRNENLQALKINGGDLSAETREQYDIFEIIKIRS